MKVVDKVVYVNSGSFKMLTKLVDGQRDQVGIPFHGCTLLWMQLSMRRESCRKQ